jgi:predicted TPR repeat methyltransferase
LKRAKFELNSTAFVSPSPACPSNFYSKNKMSVIARLPLSAAARRRFSTAHADQHASNIVDQFSKQAVPFSSAPAIADPHAIRQIIAACNASASDTVLDVACGGGVVATEFAPHVKHITGICLYPTRHFISAFSSFKRAC